MAINLYQQSIIKSIVRTLQLSIKKLGLKLFSTQQTFVLFRNSNHRFFFVNMFQYFHNIFCYYYSQFLIKKKFDINFLLFFNILFNIFDIIKRHFKYIITLFIYYWNKTYNYHTYDVYTTRVRNVYKNIVLKYLFNILICNINYVFSILMAN